MAPQLFRNLNVSELFMFHPTFQNFNVSSEIVRTFAVGKDNDFELYRKILELAPPPTLQVLRYL